MSIFSTKDFSANKTTKVRLAFGRMLGKPGVEATNNEINDALTQYCRELVEKDETAAWVATKPSPDPL